MNEHLTWKQMHRAAVDEILELQEALAEVKAEVAKQRASRKQLTEGLTLLRQELCAAQAKIKSLYREIGKLKDEAIAAEKTERHLLKIVDELNVGVKGVECEGTEGVNGS